MLKYIREKKDLQLQQAYATNTYLKQAVRNDPFFSRKKPSFHQNQEYQQDLEDEATQLLARRRGLKTASGQIGDTGQINAMPNQNQQSDDADISETKLADLNIDSKEASQADIKDSRP